MNGGVDQQNRGREESRYLQANFAQPVLWGAEKKEAEEEERMETRQQTYMQPITQEADEEELVFCFLWIVM